MASPPRHEVRRFGQLSYAFHVVGGNRPIMRDAYHALLRMPWWRAISLIVASYLVLNALFGLMFFTAGGVANARPGSYADAFFFSIQTMGTIGYGTMYPVSTAANLIVVLESVAGLLVTALATGLVFVRFSQTRGRVLFSAQVAIGPMDGVPTLMLRLGNERNNIIYDADMRLTIVRTRRTAEGHAIYMNEELKLVRGRAFNLQQAWNVLHRIEPDSPLHGLTPDALAASEAELMIAMTGTDDTSLQPVHARHIYEHTSIVWGARLADVLSELPNGDMQLDLTRFHALEPTPATATFPYCATLP